MAIPNGTADERDVWRALVVDEFSDATWSEYLQAGSRADDGRDPAGTTTAPADDHTPASKRRAATDGGEPGGRASSDARPSDGGQRDTPELVELHVGDHVRDRKHPETPLIVVARPSETAAEYMVDDPGTAADDVTVADLNPEYPAEDDVVEAVYAQRTDVDLEEKRYAFPRSRLRLEAALHDRDDEAGDA